VTDVHIAQDIGFVVSFNDLASTHRELSKELLDVDAATISAGSGRKVRWICPLGHIWSATIAGRAGRGRGCPSCAKYGFSPSKPAHLYLIEHVELDLLQIGISNDIERRLKTHARKGWNVVEVQGPWGVGEVAHQWEQSILKYLRSHGALLAPDAGIEKFDGYTEAWLRSTFPVSSLKQLRSLVDDEDWDLDQSA